jgi:hypothetical protein
MKLITLVLAFSGCATFPPVTTTATCETACLHGHNLGCDWATPTKMGASCLDVCENASRTVPWDVQQLTSATACK